MKYLYKTTALASIGFLLIGGAANAAPAENMDTKELLSLSLEQLSNIEVTSVSKKAEKASEAAAAIYVITSDDINRSGMQSIPELLRMVPGLNVAQSGNHQWAVSARGFNGSFANKLLVLIDGRSVYTPLFSGVYWDVQDTPLQDIERIEIIRGPGATLFGANAVNGVINIITKSAKDTVGGLVSVTAGNQDRALTTERYGMKLSDNAYVRTYVKYDERDEFRSTNGDGAKDPSHKFQAGFRSDWEKGDSNKYTFQGDVYEDNNREKLNLPTLTSPYTNVASSTETAKGANLLGRFEHKYSKDSNLTLQMYFDNTDRSNAFTNDNVVNTFDIDIQHAWTPTEGHEIVWGGGYRLITDSVNSSDYFNLTPSNRTDNLFSAFVQDKMTLHPDDLFLTLGSKLEHNDYTGFEAQPSARLTYLINDKQTLWSSVSHAVRTPNRSSDDSELVLTTAILPGPTPALMGIAGNRNLLSEEMNAYELGYRIQPVKNLSLDVTGFYNDYSRIVMGSLGAPVPRYSSGFGSYLYVPIIPANVNNARSYGFEASSKWEVNSRWNLSASYSYLDIKFATPDNGFLFVTPSPNQQFNVMSNLHLPYNIEMDNALYYVDKIKGSSPVPSYYRFDTRLAWKATDNIELSIVGQNLLDNSHFEFPAYVYQNNAEVPRAFYGNITWKF